MNAAEEQSLNQERKLILDTLQELRIRYRKLEQPPVNQSMNFSIMHLSERSTAEINFRPKILGRSAQFESHNLE